MDTLLNKLPEDVMGFFETELESVGLEVDLESPEFNDVEIDYYNFMKILELDQHGGLPLDDFGSGFEIRKTGVYLKIPGEAVLAALTTHERDVILQHPKGRPDEPVLAFRFTLKELKFFLDWAANVGHDVPINVDALLEVIQAQKAGLSPIVHQGPQSQSVSVRHKSVHQQRVEVIQIWFNSQCKFTKDNLRPLKSEHGQPWARQACWDWLCEQGFTSEGRLFGNAKQSDTTKSKAFIKAWSSFINLD